MSARDDASFLCRNAVDVIGKEELAQRLEQCQKDKRPLRVKAGFDPSAPDIHLGHTVLLRKLREFQDRGHTVVFIIGDYTAMIGDPTGQTKTRPTLTKEQIEQNAKTYQDQAFKILDKKKTEIVRNSSWLDAPEMFRVFFEKLGAGVTVDQLLQREDFDKRRKAHQPISMREFIYPLLQGYDSVKVQADIELGGTDQKFNLLMGRQLQTEFGQKPQLVMTMPLLVGLDGANKMSKSLGNYVAVNDTAKDMFGKLMSIPDALMQSYFDLLTSEDGARIAGDVASGKLHPKEAKKKLASEIVSFYYGKAQGEKEAEEFDRVFSRKEEPLDPVVVSIPAAEINSAGLLKLVKAAPSSSEAYRLIQQGAITLDGEKISDPKAKIKPRNGSLLKVGKKLILKLVVK